MRYLLILIPSILLILCSCQGNKINTLIGSWSAVSVVENKKPLDVDLSKINFTFNPDNTYQFNSTLNYKEAGKYSLEGDKLYTLDSLNQTSSGKIVLIEKLSSDTLKLRMKKESASMLVVLTKD